MELKRIYKEISLEADKDIDAKSRIKAFNIDNMNIIVDEENIMSVNGESVIRISKEEFFRRSVRCIKELLKGLEQ